MIQYNRIKAKHPDALLLFRVGDFYETFSQDAIIASEVLGIVLTQRANGAASHIELAGFPHHAIDTYLPKLVKAGYRVAICEQLEDPKMTKKIVKRGVTELVTPGVVINDHVLDQRKNNYLGSLQFDESSIGLALLDISTGDFLTTQGKLEYIDKLLQAFQPSEIIFAKGKKKYFNRSFGDRFYTHTLEDWIFNFEFAEEKLLRQFDTQSLKGFGIEGLDSGIIASAAALQYLDETEHPDLIHINTIARIPEEKYVWLDKFTIRNLELFSSAQDGGKPLIEILNTSISPMGARLMKKWLALPLKEIQAIEARLDTVEYMLKEPGFNSLLEKNIKVMGDLERIVSKIAAQKILPREVLQLKRSLEAVQPIKEVCSGTKLEIIRQYGDKLNPCKVLCDHIGTTLKPDPPALATKGRMIADGVSPELDGLRNITSNGREMLVKIQQEESERTGIPSLKIGFNNVFGYYLEVTNVHKEKVPEEWVRKQTLVNAERYITDELKYYEDKILGAEEKIIQLEITLFNELIRYTEDYIKPIQLDAQLIAELDCLLAFAKNAKKHNYRRPELHDDEVLDIKDGRHPVIEQSMPLGEAYVPNDLFLDPGSQQIIIITGPNMSGKSAVLRQTALITLMAQVGSFVPAKAAHIGIVDKIFTRVGASDNISSGESTFMVEMNETASIVNNISDKSLVLLDEIGRGTATFDGISIAWSLAEFLHDNANAMPKTLFATHYHELTELAERHSRIRNFNVATRESGNKVIFLRKMEPGSSKHSFGIHVARMAGMPKQILARAEEILHQLEKKNIEIEDGNNTDQILKSLPTDRLQLNMFAMDDPEIQKLREELKLLDLNTLTPIEALLKLQEWKKLLDK